MNTMKEKLWTVLVASVILQCFGKDDAYSVVLEPSPIAEVVEGNTLSLECRCNGSKTPDYVSWYLNDDTLGLVIDTSSCKYMYLTTLGQYDFDRYNISCHESKCNLSIANTSRDKDDQAIWKCDTTVTGMVAYYKASTTIEVTSAVPPDTKSGQHDKPDTVVAVTVPVVAVTVPVVAVPVVAFVAILVARRYRKRRNDSDKNMKKENYDQPQEQREMLGATGGFLDNIIMLL